MITARNDDREITRNSSHFKEVVNNPEQAVDESAELPEPKTAI